MRPFGRFDRLCFYLHPSYLRVICVVSRDRLSLRELSQRQMFALRRQIRGLYGHFNQTYVYLCLLKVVCPLFSLSRGYFGIAVYLCQCRS